MAEAGDQVRSLAENAHAVLSAWSSNPFAPPTRRMAAYYELVALAGFTHSRPDYGIDSVEVRGETVAVEEKGVLWTPFCQLLRFRREGGADDPNILLVAPMSGHFATLLRGTIRTLLRDHQVFVTDWINPRNVRLEDGDFALHDYTQHIIDFIGFIGEDCHVVAVCQPTVSALAATAVLAQDGGAVQPASLTLMAGPIDARVAPTKVNELAQERPIEWFRSTTIGIVPDKFEGAGRRVYPGFLQLCAFMSMNAERHTKSLSTSSTIGSRATSRRPMRSVTSTRNISRSWT
jgi:polyhydroxyalkanoate depolymerase